MRLSVKGLLVTALVAFVAGLAGMGIGLRIWSASSPPSLHEVMHERLNLSAMQLSEIEHLEETFAARKQALELELRTANAELAAAIREEHGYGPRVTAAVDHFHDAMGRLQSETIAHVFAMRAVLNDQQKAVFDDAVASNLTADLQ